MSDESNQPRPPAPAGAEPFEVVYSTKVLREQRRAARNSGIFGVVVSLILLAVSARAWHNHTWIDMGTGTARLLWPPWVAALLSLLFLVGSVAVLCGYGVRKS
jgi:hypothetical protein